MGDWLSREGVKKAAAMLEDFDLGTRDAMDWDQVPWLGLGPGAVPWKWSRLCMQARKTARG